MHCSGDDESPNMGSAINTSTEQKAGNLVFTHPERGAFVEQTQEPLQITGTGATPALTINGQPATVAKDGTFTATMQPTPGLNIIKATDGEFGADSAFLYGHFVKLSEPLPQGIALNLGAKAISGADPVASLSSVSNLYLKGRTNLLEALKGQKFSGSKGPASFDATITGIKNGNTTLALTPVAGGLNVVVTMRDINATASVTGKAIGVSVTRPATARTTAVMTGVAKLSLVNGAIKAAIPSASTRLDGFSVDISGLPGGLDGIVADKIRPVIENGASQYVKAEVPKLINLTLDGLGLPKEIDLKALEIAPMPLATQFDGVDFTTTGGTLTASVRFGATEYNGGQPGVRALGWLEVSKAPSGNRPDSAAASISMDTFNQLLLAVWGGGSLQRPVPDTGPVAGLRINPLLPPVVLPGEAPGTLKIALGEVGIEGTLNGAPFTAAVSLIQDVAPSIEGTDLLVTPKGEANLSVTWLKADDIPDTLRKVVVGVAKDQLGTFLKSLRLPIPSIALGALGGGFANQALRLDAPQINVDAATARIDVVGTLKLTK
jgi:hypothetical protein